MEVTYRQLKHGLQVQVSYGPYRGVRTFRNRGQADFSLRKLNERLADCETEPLLRQWVQGRLRGDRVPRKDEPSVVDLPVKVNPIYPWARIMYALMVVAYSATVTLLIAKLVR
jgi:hypothetical protein